MNISQIYVDIILCTIWLSAYICYVHIRLCMSLDFSSNYLLCNLLWILYIHVGTIIYFWEWECTSTPTYQDHSTLEQSTFIYHFLSIRLISKQDFSTVRSTFHAWIVVSILLYHWYSRLYDRFWRDVEETSHRVRQSSLSLVVTRGD